MAESHGRATTIYMKQYGGSSYVLVGKVIGDITYGLERDTVKLDNQHGVTLQKAIADPMNKLVDISFQVHLDETDASHDEATGLQKWQIASPPEATTIEIRGPNYSAPSTEMTRISGFVTKATKTAPVANPYLLDTMFVPDGSDLQINGVAVT